MIEETIVFNESNASTGGAFFRKCIVLFLICVVSWICMYFFVSSQFVHSSLLSFLTQNWNGKFTLSELRLRFPFTLECSELALKNTDGKKVWMKINGVRISPAWFSLFSKPLSVSVDYIYSHTYIEGNGSIQPYQQRCKVNLNKPGNEPAIGNILYEPATKYGNIPPLINGSEIYNYVKILPLSKLIIKNGEIKCEIETGQNNSGSRGPNHLNGDSRETITLFWHEFSLAYDFLSSKNEVQINLLMNSSLAGTLSAKLRLLPDESMKDLPWEITGELKGLELANGALLLKGDIAHLFEGGYGKLSLAINGNGKDLLLEEGSLSLSVKDLFFPLPVGSVSASSILCSLQGSVGERTFLTDLKISSLNKTIEQLQLTVSGFLEANELAVKQLFFNADGVTLTGKGTVVLPPFLAQAMRIPEGQTGLRASNRMRKGLNETGLRLMGQNIPLPSVDLLDPAISSEWIVDENVTCSLQTVVSSDHISVINLSCKGDRCENSFSGRLELDNGGLINGTLYGSERKDSSLQLCGLIWSPSITLKEKR